MGNAYGGQDLQEFVAEFMGNAEFRALLDTIKAPKGNAKDSLLSRIIDSILKLLRIRKQQTAYDVAFKYVSDLVDVAGTAEASLPDILFFSTPDAALDALDRADLGGNNADPRLVRAAESLFKKTKDVPLLKLFWSGARLDHMYRRFKAAAEAGDKNFN